VSDEMKDKPQDVIADCGQAAGSELWLHMVNNHGIHLLDSEVNDLKWVAHREIMEEKNLIANSAAREIAVLRDALRTAKKDAHSPGVYEAIAYALGEADDIDDIPNAKLSHEAGGEEPQ